MVNRLLKNQGKTKATQPEAMVRVFNRQNRSVTFGVHVLAPNDWTEVPESLARRLVDDLKYEVEGMSRRKRPAYQNQRAVDKTVDIIIPVHGQLDYLTACVASIKRNVEDYNLIFVDDASDEETAAWMDEQDAEVYRHETPLGFGRSCNEGMVKSSSPWICVLNSDTIVTPHAMSVMHSVASLGFGIVGPTTCNSSGIQCDHTIAPKRHDMTVKQIEEIGRQRSHKHLTEYAETDVFGFCMLISREVVEVVGGFDWRRYKDGYVEDWDLVWRAQQCGFRSAWAMGAYVHHYGHKSFENRIGWPAIKALSDRNHQIFAARKETGESLYFDPREGISDE